MQSLDEITSISIQSQDTYTDRRSLINHGGGSIQLLRQERFAASQKFGNNIHTESRNLSPLL